MTHQSPLSLAIQQHHKALAELDALGSAQVAAEEAHIATNRADQQLAEAFEAADAAFNESCSRQSDAHEAVLSAPVLTLSDMQVKAAHLADTMQYTIHDASTMRKLLSSVAQPSDEDGDSIERMYSEWSALFTRDASGETDEQADSTYAVLEGLQSRIINAPARSPRDVALQFMADTHNNTSDPSGEFTEALARLATVPADPAPVVSAQHLVHADVATLPSTASTFALSQVVNDLFGAYVAIEREQERLAKAGLEEEADALGSPALEAQGRVLALRDRSANPDLIAARVMAEQMLLHNWRRVEAGEAIDWSHEDREIALPLLEAVADRTTGTVREHTRLALATIGVEIEPEVADPLLALVTEYRTQLNAFNASPRTLSPAEDAALEAKTWGPPYAVLMGGDVPNATTLSGAIAALRELHREFVDCGGADHMAIAVLPAVMAFFDASSAGKMRERAAAVEGAAIAATERAEQRAARS